jgi:membrane associated rhomboid family serine protease
MAEPTVEYTIGRSRFAGVYVLSGLTAMVAESVRDHWCDGASGALLGAVSFSYTQILSAWLQ